MVILPGAAEAQFFPEEGCPGDRLMLIPHQQAQASASAGRGKGAGVAAGRSGEDVRIHQEQGRDHTGSSGGPHGSFARAIEGGATYVPELGRSLR